MSVTLSQSHKIEEATRCQSAAPEWHSLRKERVTASTFREVSYVRGPTAAEDLAERVIRGMPVSSYGSPKATRTPKQYITLLTKYNCQFCEKLGQIYAAVTMKDLKAQKILSIKVLVPLSCPFSVVENAFT